LDFKLGGLVKVVFHNAFSPFRQTEGQRGCNEILKGPFFFLFVYLYLPLPPSLSEKTSVRRLKKQQHAGQNEERKIWKQIILFLLPPLYSITVCVCHLIFFLMHSLQLSPSKCDYLPSQTHITLGSMWKREAYGESKGRENRMYIAVDESNW